MKLLLRVKFGDRRLGQSFSRTTAPEELYLFRYGLLLRGGITEYDDDEPAEKTPYRPTE